jgi:hypothetical protein
MWHTINGSQLLHWSLGSERPTWPRRRPGTEPLTTGIWHPWLAGQADLHFLHLWLHGAVPYPPPPLCHQSRACVRAGIRRPKRRTAIVGHGAYRMSPVPREPLTTWKLRYKASSMRNVDSIVILPALRRALLALLAYAHSYSLPLYSPTTLKPIIRLIIARAPCYWSL